MAPGRGSHFLPWCSHWLIAHAPGNDLLSMHMEATLIKSWAPTEELGSEGEEDMSGRRQGLVGLGAIRGQ